MIGVIDLLYGFGILIPLTHGAYTDYKSRIIPNRVCLAVLVAGLLGAAWLPPESRFFVPLWIRAAGIVPAAIMVLLAYFKGGIGGGDIKLTAALGFALGYYTLVVVLLAAAVSGCLWAVWRKKKSVPLAAFLLAGTILVFCLRDFKVL